MSSSVRRCAMLLMWLALALLPLRGWANAVMHLPPGSATAATAASPAAVPCHGNAAIDGADAAGGEPCMLCDLCHATALPAAAPAVGRGFLPPRVARVQPLALAGMPATFFRPPRA